MTSGKGEFTTEVPFKERECDGMKQKAHDRD
jgi:hypothetical protein